MSNGPKKTSSKYPFGEGKTRPDQKAKRCREAGGTWQNGKCVFTTKEDITKLKPKQEEKAPRSKKFDNEPRKASPDRPKK